MKLCFSTLGCPDWRWNDIVAAAVDLGYNGIEVRGVGSELFVPRIMQLREEHREHTLKRLAGVSLQIPILTSGCELQRGEIIDETIFQIKEYIDLASAIGTPYIRVLGDTDPAPSDSVDEGLVKDAAQLLGAYAHEKGATLLIETNGWFADTGRLAKLLESINSPAVAALWDLNHPYRYNGESVDDVINDLGDSIRHVHIKDSVMQDGRLVYRVTGQGDLPIAECVEKLGARGFDGFFSLEWVRRWNMSLEEPGIAFALYSQYMRSIG